MDQTLKKICGLLENKDNARRCAGAIVLAELAPKNTDVVKALGAVLPEANELLAKALLDALTAIGSPAGAVYALPLLDSPDMDIRMRAVQVVARAGDSVIPQIREQMKTAPHQKKLLLIDLLARIHSGEALDTILGLLFEPDFGLVREACDAVKRHVSETDPKERLKLHKQVAKFMSGSKAQASERVLTSSLLLLGHIGRPEAVQMILKHTAAKTVPYVRRHAFIALKGVDLDGGAAKALVSKILPCLEDSDEDVARHALDILSKLPTDGISGAKWRALLKGRHGSARAYAARMLAASDTADTNRLLMELLEHEDNEIREIAQRALAAHPKALPRLMKQLSAAKKKPEVWALFRILKGHAPQMDKKDKSVVQRLAAKACETGAETSEPLLAFLRDIDAKAAEELLLETGMAHRKAKRWTAAIDCLRLLLHTGTFTDDVSYALSVCDLKVSHKELAPQYREGDHALRGLGILRRRNQASLLERIRKDKSLDSKDLYYVGFHFVDGTGDEPAFGREILELVTGTWPKSPEAKMARERLKRM